MSNLLSKAVGLFGPKVLGRDAYEAERAVLKTKSHIYGPKVLIPSNPGAPAVVAAAAAPSGASGATGAGAAAPDRGPFAAVRAALAAAGRTAEEIEAEIERLTEMTGGADVGQEEDADANGDGYLTEAEVADALEKQPELFDRLLDMEFARSASGASPRKGVLRRLLKHEKAQATPRPEVVHLLETQL